MAMGDVSGAVGTDGFRGSRRVRPVINLHRHADSMLLPIDLAPYLVEMVTSKSIDGSPGTWSLTLRGRGMFEGGGPVSQVWHEEMSDEDWVRIGVEEGGVQWLIMIGIIDRVRYRASTDGGARHDEWVVTGRDLGKAFVDSDILMMPWASFDPILSAGTFYSAFNALENLPGGAGPGLVIRQLYDFMMLANLQRVPGTPWWAVPPNIPLSLDANAAAALDPMTRQVSDLIDDSRIEMGLLGKFGAYASIMAAPNQGGNVWSIMQQHANLVLNELYVDVVAPQGLSQSPLAYASAGDISLLTYGLVLREKPFPSAPGSAYRPDDDPWDKLPTTTIDMLDTVDVDLCRGVDERYNYFLVESGGGNLMGQMVIAQASLWQQAGSPAQRMLNGVPCIDVESVRRTGLRRLEQTSNYVNINGGQLDVYTGWSRLLRDWYILNPDYFSGSVQTWRMLPGVRIGERLILTDAERGGEALEFYVEGVTHALTVEEKGRVTHSTSLTVTRGHPNPVGAIREKIGGAFQLPSVIFPNVGDQASIGEGVAATAVAAGVRTGAAAAGIATPSIQPIAGIDANGEPFAVLGVSD